MNRTGSGKKEGTLGIAPGAVPVNIRALTMILLPVIERELRVTARNRRTYRNRFLAGLAFVGVLLFVIWDRRRASQAEMGVESFGFLTYTALVVALAAGLFQTADAISEERREGTLGLLFLTDLRSLHVVLGKLFARSVDAFSRSRPFSLSSPSQSS